MDKLVDNADSESSSDWEVEDESTSKLGVLDFDMSAGTACSKDSGENHAGSSGSNLRSCFIGMGFSPTRVDKVIKEYGEENMDLLLETLIAKSELKKSSSESSDSLDALFSGCSNGFSSPESATIDNAMEEITTEALFGTMDKTLCLLEMGFSEHEISLAIERLGSEVPVSELADSIFANQLANTCVENDEELSTRQGMHFSHTESDWRSLSKEKGYNQCSAEIKIEEIDWRSLGGETGQNKRCSEIKIEETEVSDSNSVPHANEMNFENIVKGKKPKYECDNDYDSTFCLRSPKPEARIVEPRVDRCSSVNQMAAKPPYFFFGNVMDVSHDYWARISQYLYAVEPEFVNAQFFSALSRKEGYIHNLPNGNRFHILPRPPMTIEDAIPHTRKWWPSWDTRKQLSCISSETPGISQLCDRLGKILVDSQGVLSVEQQRDILHHCKTLNLIWVGQYKLRPIEPDQVERILGYPLHHTLVADCDPNERLRSLKHCFQADTLGYHISVLRLIFPDGLTMLSLYSGIGGAEVALHRLGVRLKCVVSVESSATNRKILKKWWHNTGQTGKLVQIEDIHRLTTSKLESLMKEFCGFDFVICQNPCTYISGSSKVAADGDNPAGLDFQLFYEFVRILQRVRSSMGRNR